MTDLLMDNVSLLVTQDADLNDQEIPILTAEGTTIESLKSILPTDDAASTFSDADSQVIAENKIDTEAPPPQKSKKNLNLSSEVWNHFSMGTEGLSVICNYCSRKMKRTDSSTKSMWGHLKSFHTQDVGPEVFDKKRNRRVFNKRLATDNSADASFASIASLLNGSGILDLSENNIEAENIDALQPKRKRYRTKRIIALENQLQQEMTDGFDPSTSSAAAQLFLLSQLPSASNDFNSLSNGLANELSLDSEILRHENCASHESHQSGESTEDNINGNSNNTTTTSSSASPFNANDLQSLSNTNDSLFQNCVNAFMFGNGFGTFTENGNELNKRVLEELLKQLLSSQDINIENFFNSGEPGEINDVNAPSSSRGNTRTSSIINNMLGMHSTDLQNLDFYLHDGKCIDVMHQIARDLRLTYLFRETNGQTEYIFTADKTDSLNYEGVRRIVLVDHNDQIQIREVTSEGVINTEYWEKTNLTQVMWAIRGKCQKTLCE